MLLKKTKLADFILMKHEGKSNNIAYQAIRTNAKRGPAGFGVQIGSVEFYGKHYSFHEKCFPPLSGTHNFGSKLKKPTQQDKMSRNIKQSKSHLRHLPYISMQIK